jgi:hypothetical protein
MFLFNALSAKASEADSEPASGSFLRVPFEAVSQTHEGTADPHAEKQIARRLKPPRDVKK